MRILMITPLYPPTPGGAATYFGLVTGELILRNEIERLIVLTENTKDRPTSTSRGKLELVSDLVPRVSAKDFNRTYHTLSYLWTQLWFAARLHTLVERFNIDLIHYHTRLRGRLFHRALKGCGVPIIADLRDKMSDPRQLFDVADHVLCCSQGVWEYAMESGNKDRMSLIPVPFSAAETPGTEKVRQVHKKFELEETPYLLFLGDITPAKGVYELLSAYRIWNRSHPTCKLVFAGPNREGKKFTAQVSNTAGVSYLGGVPKSDALALTSGAEILILPSRSEGLPRVVLEAVAVGTKVICPPHVPEFDRALPDFTLSEISCNAILDKLHAVWNSETLPSYPLHVHDLGLVVEQLTQLYGRLA